MATCLILKRVFPLFWGYSLRLVREPAPLTRRDRVFLHLCNVVCFLLWMLAEAARWITTAIVVVGIMHLMGVSAAKGADLIVPRAANQYKALLIRAAHAEMGLEAPIALLAAQIHTESLWRANALSPVGAQGLAQFMPSTANWLPNVAPHTGEPAPFNPGWAVRAMCAYDLYIYRQVRGAASACDQWAFTLSAYNGGLGWVQRDQVLAAKQGSDPGLYWNSVELFNAGRSAAAFTENRNYPRKIFSTQRAYEAAGWGRGVRCDR